MRLKPTYTPLCAALAGLLLLPSARGATGFTDLLIADRVDTAKITAVSLLFNAPARLSGDCFGTGKLTFQKEIAFLFPQGDVPMGAFTNRMDQTGSPPIPAWWETYQVISPSAIPNDFAAATQGQLKWIASRAAALFQDEFPGGPTPAVTQLLATFTLKNNTSPVTLGQLKNTAEPFWNFLRLHRLAETPPWADGIPNDFALANIGQVKYLFSFDLESLQVDSDADGMPDWWEILYNLNPYDPTDAALDSDGDGLINQDEFRYGTHPQTPDADLDSDDDGVSNVDEVNDGTNPCERDSDGDGIPDDIERAQKTDPNDPGDKPGEWVILTGDLPKNDLKEKQEKIIIPKGTKSLIAVFLHSEEFPEYTGDVSEYNDTLGWNITAAGHPSLAGTVDVNSRHSSWEIAEYVEDGIQSFSPAIVEDFALFSAPADKDLEVSVSLYAKNISDDLLPSTVIAAAFPLRIVQKNMPVAGGHNGTTDTNGARTPMRIKTGGISYVTGEPAAPDLFAEFKGLPRFFSVGWRMDLLTEDFFGRKTRDNRSFPETGYKIQAGNEIYDIKAELNEIIGGTNTVSIQINNRDIPPVSFLIRGKNPLDDDVLAYINSTVDVAFRPYAWMIAKHESKMEPWFYNQFVPEKFKKDPRIPETVLRGPIKGYGFGISQIDRGSKSVVTAEAWNWRTNVETINTTFKDKRNQYKVIIDAYRNAYGENENWIEPPARYTNTVDNVVVVLSAEAWGVITLYNGRGGIKPIPIPGAAKWMEQSPWKFDPVLGVWKLYPNKNNYVDEVVKVALKTPTE